MKKIEKIRKNKKVRFGKALCHIDNMSEKDISFLKVDGKIYMETSPETMRAIAILLEELIDESRNKEITKRYFPLLNLKLSLETKRNIFLKDLSK